MTMAPQASAVGIAGTGRVAQALGRLLVEAGEPVVAVGGRNPERARTAAAFVGARPAAIEELPSLTSQVLIAVSDDALESVAAMLAGAGMRSGIALHTSGVHGPEALQPLVEAGVSCGVLHPLQTIANPEAGLRALQGIAYGVTAQGAALEWAERIVTLARGWVLHVPPEGRAAYHAAAVVASNFVPALIDAAVMLMEMAGARKEAALRALAPLVRTSYENALAMGPVAALTGPVARGDWRTVAMHWQALAGSLPAVRELYRAASLQLVEIARRRGMAPEIARRIEELFV